jgi:DNA-binding winged helix-turn-helix (wHTH) protein/tetratricopeptide (TPR) repeat protein
MARGRAELPVHYDFGPYRVDPMQRVLFRNDEIVPLPPKAVAVLVELLRKPGEVVPKQTLMTAVWPTTFVEEANLTQMIFLLRQALTRDGNGAGQIHTIPRRGYRFIGCVRSSNLLISSPFDPIRTIGSKARSLYLKGRFVYRGLSQDALTRALHYFRSATEVEPEFPEAYAALSDTLVTMACFSGVSPKVALAEAESAALTSVRLGENLAEAHLALGFVQFHLKRDCRAAEASLDRAVLLKPLDADILWKYGCFLQDIGRVDEAYAVRRRAEEIDPFSLVVMEEVGWPLYYARRYSDAAAQFDKVVELAPNWHMGYYGLGMARLQQGDYFRAIAEFEKAASFSGPSVVMAALRAHCYGRLGRSRDALRILDRLNLQQASDHVLGYFLAVIYLGLGDRNRAVECLEKACGKSEFDWLNSLHHDPMMDSLRLEPRFKQVIRWLNLKQ